MAHCTVRKRAEGTPQLPWLSWASTKSVCRPGASPVVKTVACTDSAVAVAPLPGQAAVHVGQVTD